MDGDKFYRFEETSAEPIGSSEKSKSSKRERIFWIICVLLLIGAVIGVSIYFTQKDQDDDSSIGGKTDEQSGGKITTPMILTTKSPITEAPTTNGPTNAPTRKPDMDEMLKRIDCIPEAHGGVVEATLELCDRRGCTYSDTGEAGIPACYFGSDQGYRVTSYEDTTLGFRVYLNKKIDGPFGNDLEKAVFELEMRGDNIIRFKVRLYLNVYFFNTKQVI